MNQPYSLQIDTNGDIYIVDRLNAVIRKVEAATGIITTVAGTGEPGRVAMVVRGHAPSCASPTTVFSMVAAGSSLPMCRTSASGAWICVPESSLPLLGPGQGAGWRWRSCHRRQHLGRGPCMDHRGNTYICERKGMVFARWTHTASCQPTPVLASVATVVTVVRRSPPPGGTQGHPL